jgi:hypothetical protein
MAQYDAVFWCESDVRPIRTFWLDELAREALTDREYWVKVASARPCEIDEAVLRKTACQ